MKILFYTDSDYFSGAERVFLDIAAGLSAEKLLVLNPRIASKADQYNREKDLAVKYQASRSKLAFWLMFRFARVIRSFEPKICVVNMQTPFANTWFLIACAFTKTKTITVWHLPQEKFELKGLTRPVKLFAYRLAFRLSHKIVTVSQWHQEVLKKQFGAPASKLVTIVNGVPDQGESNPQRLRGGPLKLVSVGTLEQRKNQVWLLSVLKRLPGLWELVVVGDGPDRQQLARLVEKEGLGDRVTLTGYQASATSVLKTSQLLVHPALMENLSLVIIEALSCGLPVIANAIGGNGELVVNGQNGWLLPANDSEAWIKALTTAQDEIILARFGKASRQLFLDEFTQPKMIKNYQKLIDQYE